jgi:hypothetical protein
MKKTLLVIMLALFATSAFAQVKFGVKGGINLSSANIEMDGEKESYDSKLGPLFGAFAEFQLSEKFAFMPELVYSMEGGKSDMKYSENWEGSEVSISLEDDFKLNYLNLPLLFKFKVGNGIGLYAGPQIGFLLSAEYKYTMTASFEGMSETDSETIDIKEDMKSTNVSLGFGASYETQMGLGLDARYNLGLSNIADDSDASMKTKGFQFSVFYKF